MQLTALTHISLNCGDNFIKSIVSTWFNDHFCNLYCSYSEPSCTLSQNIETTLLVVNLFGAHLPKTAFADGSQNFKVVEVDYKTKGITPKMFTGYFLEASR